MRTFKLHRLIDVSGVSGSGIVAEGVEFKNGQCALHWLTRFESIGLYPSRDVLMQVHGHDGATVLVEDISDAASFIQLVTKT